MTRTLAIGSLALLAGCTGHPRQSALDPAGVQAEHIGGLWDAYLGVTVLVYVLVMLVLFAGVLLRRRRGTAPPETVPPPERERIRGALVAAALVVTVIILFGLLLGDFLAGRGIDSLAEPNAMTIRVTAHQWWWEVRYDAPTASDVVTTANELHLPVGTPVHFELMASDVIHSFWVPNLHGKTDMIPGHTTHTYVRADRPGEFWGQCAEFCGLQHANMRLVVVAEPEDDFQKWLAAQRRPAADPTTDAQKKGQQVFLTKSCVLCHAITGTPAGSRVGPDLTHLASRSRLAAGTLPNVRGHLAGWVTDAQSVKPGSRMPPNPLAPDDLHPLLDYLESLK